MLVVIQTFTSDARSIGFDGKIILVLFGTGQIFRPKKVFVIELLGPLERPMESFPKTVLG